MSDSPANPAQATQVGPHCFWVEPDSILHIQLVGDVELAHAKVIAHALTDAAGNRGVYFLRDARRAGTITRQAREFLVRSLKSGVLIAVVTFGSSFHASVMANIIVRGLRVLGQRLPLAVFFDNEAQARAWIAKHRATAAAKSPITPNA